MPYLDEALKKKQQELTNLIFKLENLSCLKVKGNIKVKKTVHPQIEYRRSKEDKFVPLRKAEIGTAKVIAQRDYALKLLRKSRKQLTRVESMLQRYNPDELNDIYTFMNPGRKYLVSPYRMSDDEFASRWLQQEYPSRNTYASSYTLNSEKGDKVRSKSEKIIADKLFYMGIPYFYEFPIRLKNGRRFYPDFTILNKRTRKVYLLEHMGMLGENNYREKNLPKLKEYMLNGYNLGTKLLITFETDGRDLDVKLLEVIIKDYLI